MVGKCGEKERGSGEKKEGVWRKYIICGENVKFVGKMLKTLKCEICGKIVKNAGEKKNHINFLT